MITAWRRTACSQRSSSPPVATCSSTSSESSKIARSGKLIDEGAVRTLRRISSAGQRMTDMIDQLLDLTRARLAGGLGFERVRKRLDVAELVQRRLNQDGHRKRAPEHVSTSNPARAPSGVVVILKPLKLDRLLDTVAELWSPQS